MYIFMRKKNEEGVGVGGREEEEVSKRGRI
jgi:hypothetical protein